MGATNDDPCSRECRFPIYCSLQYSTGKSQMYQRKPGSTEPEKICRCSSILPLSIMHLWSVLRDHTLPNLKKITSIWWKFGRRHCRLDLLFEGVSFHEQRIVSGLNTAWKISLGCDYIVTRRFQHSSFSVKALKTINDRRASGGQSRRCL